MTDSDDWAVGTTVIEWKGKTLLLEKNGERRRVEYVGEAEMEVEIRELNRELGRLAQAIINRDADMEILRGLLAEALKSNPGYLGTAWMDRARRALELTV